MRVFTLATAVARSSHTARRANFLLSPSFGQLVFAVDATRLFLAQACSSRDLLSNDTRLDLNK